MVLVKLINNARDAGATRIEVAAHAESAAGAPQVVIRVDDNGPGIPANVLPIAMTDG